MKLLPIIVGVAAVIALSSSACGARAQDRPALPQDDALAGIGGLDPQPLGDVERRMLTSRAEHGELDAMYALAERALHKDGPMYYWGEWGDPR
jgi:hypothetical protein